MSDSTIKCDKCDEEFVDSESFESHKEMSHENDSFQFIDSRNAVDEEEFVRRNSTKGYNPNPNAGLYDNKLFREGSAKERTSMLGESNEDDEYEYGFIPKVSGFGEDKDKNLPIKDHTHNFTSGYQHSNGIDYIWQCSDSGCGATRNQDLYMESKANEVSQKWLDELQITRDQLKRLLENDGETMSYVNGMSQDNFEDYVTHLRNEQGSWSQVINDAMSDESKANEVDGYTVLDKDGDETPSWYESDNLSDAKREADRVSGSVIEVPSFGGVIDKEVGNIVYRSGESKATEGWREKERLRQPSDGNDWWTNTYILPTEDEAYARCTICGADVDTLTTDGDWMSDKEMLDHYDDHVSRGQITLYGESYAKEDEDQRDQSELETDTSYEDEIYGGNSGNPDNWYKTEDGEWEVVGDGESYAKEDDYKYDFDELSSLAQDKIEDGHISQLEWDDSSKEERKDLESVLHGDESDEDGTMLHGSGWNSGAETEPIESNDYLEARDQAISKALKAPIEVEDDYEKVDYEKEDELSAGFIEEQHTERTEDKNKFLDDIDISLENIDYVYPTKIGEAIGKSYITEAIEGLDEEYEGLEDSDEEEVIELVTERKMGGFSNESIARELHITYGVSPEYALSRVHGIEVTTNDKVANTFFGKKYKDCTESEKDELKMYSGSDY